MNFGSNGTHPKFIVLVHFGVQFTARKPKILLKTRTSAKTSYRPTSLGISINVSLRSQKNLVILIKVNKKLFGGPKFGLNCTLAPFLKGIINSHSAYNTTIHVHAKFQLLRICCSWLYPKVYDFWYRTQLGLFWEVWWQYIQ